MLSMRGVLSMKKRVYKENETLPFIESYLDRIDSFTLEELSNGKGEDEQEEGDPDGIQ